MRGKTSYPPPLLLVDGSERIFFCGKGSMSTRVILILVLHRYGDIISTRACTALVLGMGNGLKTVYRAGVRASDAPAPSRDTRLRVPRGSVLCQVRLDRNPPGPSVADVVCGFLR